MNYPSEIRMCVNREHDLYDDIFNNKKIVVNIKSNKINKEENIMLENEKIAELGQLNSMKCENETKLAELKAKDINAIVEERLAEIREEINAEVIAEHEKKVLKLEYLVEAINEKIAEVEAIEVEAQAEAPVVEENAVENNFVENSEII